MSTKTATYRVQVREWCVFDLFIVADSVSDAMGKAKIFYTSYREPVTKFEEDGLTATLQENSVRYRRQTASQSGWAKARSAARDSHRDDAEAS